MTSKCIFCDMIPQDRNLVDPFHNKKQKFSRHYDGTKNELSEEQEKM